jgi:[glutamine synthetase] adenylyltransferase / [glutamine synthetase]-adenylyl-L-tyrosine phosphorylase
MTGSSIHTETPRASDHAAHSRFVQRVRRRYAAQLALLPPGLPERSVMSQALSGLRAEGFSLDDGLRVLRQLVLERLACLDCDGEAGLDGVTQTMTTLAELCLDQACAQAHSELVAIHGQPMAEGQDGQIAKVWVIGMGKLGARELNVSSDIDLIYIYDAEGETQGNERGAKRISNHEYFAKLVKRVQASIGLATEHGQVFRVDLALRPNGNSGPSACSLGALEEYFMVQGREWERFAWLKSRVVAPAEVANHDAAGSLRDVVLPFVFRRYLDYRVFESLRRLHRQIRQHAAQQAAGRPERANDVKLARGGIREIEFIVQLLQVVRGGQFPELRRRATLDALAQLVRAQLMAPDQAQALHEAYVFLRQVEHRIQYLDDQQTQVMPTDAGDLDWIAHTLGLRNASALSQALQDHRDGVAAEFDRLLGGAEPVPATDASEEDLSGVMAQLPQALQAALSDWIHSPKVSALDDTSRERLGRLLLRTGAWLEDGRISAAAAQRMTDWLEPLLRRQSYLALLQERPSTHLRLLRLLGAARWPARYLLRHPGVIDELANADMLSERFDAAQLERELESRRAALERTAEADEETLLDLLRRAHHAEVFRTLARDVEGRLSVEAVADDLSALAQTLLSVASRWCWQHLKQRHTESPRMGIIAYGKLGGKELGYGSDLDIVFVYDDDAPQAPEAYAAWVRKLITWLTVKTGEGDLFEIDTALRPNGNSGLLVTRFDAYADYQLQRGSNAAWTWEHQAITRARLVVGDAAMQQRFEAVREGVMTAPRQAQHLRDEIIAMRTRVASAHKVAPDRFDVKHSAGAMVDIEFAVQTLLLTHSAKHAALLPNLGNIGLLKIAQEQGLLPPPMGDDAANAYRRLRHAQHQARLDEASTQMDPADWQTQRSAVLALWQHVMGQAR